MANHTSLTSLFDDIADAIRAKTGGTSNLVADAFPTAISGIPTGITPTGTINISSNGTFDVTNYASALVAVPGGVSGLDYESGIWTPQADTSRGTVNFANTHTEPPVFVALSRVGTYNLETYTNYEWLFFDYYHLFGATYKYGTNTRYALCAYLYLANSTQSNGFGNTQISNPYTDSGDSTSAFVRYWCTESSFYPNTTAATRYWRAGTYQWFALWKPTT